LLDGATVLPAGARFVKAFLKAVTVPICTAIKFSSCIVFVLFHKDATLCKIRCRGGEGAERNYYESISEYFDPFELVLRTFFVTVCRDTGLKILGMWLKTQI